MARVEGDIVISRPVEEVFDFVADERNEPRYNARMIAAELTSVGPVGEGSTFDATLATRGRPLPMTIRFTAFERPRRLASSTRSSMMDTAGVLTFEPVAEGTRMSWSWDVRPRGPVRFVPALIAVIGRRQEQRVWEGLKRLLEDELSNASAGAANSRDAGRVLVAYASRHGSTSGVAQRIADRLRGSGVQVDLQAVGAVTDLAPYRVVVLGSPVYGQHWLPDAAAFVRRNAEALAARPVWLFSVGSFGDTHRLFGRVVRREPAEIGAVRRAIHPCEYRVFAGAIARDAWPMPSRALFRALGGRFGDNRAWPRIDSWANRIAASLTDADRELLAR